MNPERNQLFYIANLGSEVSRYLDFVAKQDTLESERAWQRIEKMKVSLFGLNPTKSSIYEISTLIDYIKNPKQSGVKIEEIKRQCVDYFNPFVFRMMAGA